MSEMKHTPGPWFVDHEFTGDVYSEGPRYEIATAWREGRHKGPPTSEGAMNAHLIAAAPNLLEACRLLVDADGGAMSYSDRVNLARHAIAKAEGRS